MRRCRLPVPASRLLGVVLGIAGALPVAGEDLPPGVIVPDLAARSSPQHRYALYLPKAWIPERRWPALVVLDPRGRAVTAAEIFRSGAERYGWILLSSYDSRSDLPAGQDPNTPALEALLGEADRLGGNPERTYLAGFSGTSKFAWGAGRSLPGAVAGIIGCGGALPGPWEQWKDVEFAYFGAAGTTDFNHRSMRELDDLLDGTEVAHRFEYFPGGHQWLGADLAADAVGWMELEAMKSGLAERDVVVVERLYDRWLARARKLEEAGSVYPAWRAYRALAADFDGLRPTTRPAAAADRLAARPDWKAARDELERALAVEKEYRERLGTAMRNVAYHAEPRSLAALLAELEIELLRTRARGESFTAQAAQRQLELVFVQAAYYVPRVLFASGAPRRAALALQIAAAVRPQAADVWFQLARAQALGGDGQEALASLDRAVDEGFSDAERLRAEAAFAELWPTRGFRRLLARLE